MCVAGFITLRSIVITELLGVRHLMNALGLLFMFQGLASVVGSPLSGKSTKHIPHRLIDLTHAQPSSSHAHGLFHNAHILCFLTFLSFAGYFIFFSYRLCFILIVLLDLLPFISDSPISK